MNLFFLFNFKEAFQVCGFFFFMTIFLIVAFVVQSKLEKKEDRERKKNLKEIARKNNWEYLPQVKGIHPGTFREFRRFNPEGEGRPTMRKLQNMLTVNTEGIELRIFDYSYRFSGGKSGGTAYYTIAFYQAEGFSFPEFVMLREGISSKVEDLVKNEDVDFNSHPDFSKKFFLTGPDKDAVRNLFTSEVLDYLEKKKNTFSIEAKEDKVIFYHEGMTVFNQIDSKDIPGFSKDAATLIKMFRRSPKA